MSKSGRDARKPAEPAGQPAAPDGQALDLTDQALPGEVAELVGELTEEPGRVRRLQAGAFQLARRGGRTGWSGVRSGGRWLTTEVLAMVPRLPIRDQQTLRAQFPGLHPEELADALIQGSSRAAASVGAAVGAVMFLPLPAAPVELAVETLALVGIEVKLVAELHEVYGMRAPGAVPERALAYLAAWAHRRGVSVVPGGLVLAVGSPLRRRLERRLLVRAGRSAASLGPLLTGAAAGALLNRQETRRLGSDVRDDLRHRSAQGTRWAD
jgi:hypothetical protein